VGPCAPGYGRRCSLLFTIIIRFQHFCTIGILRPKLGAVDVQNLEQTGRWCNVSPSVNCLLVADAEQHRSTPPVLCGLQSMFVWLDVQGRACTLPIDIGSSKQSRRQRPSGTYLKRAQAHQPSLHSRHARSGHCISCRGKSDQRVAGWPDTETTWVGTRKRNEL
jgi:hypothetical protein